MAGYDHIIVGSGINALVCGAMLSGSTKVLVLEREEEIGGNMRTAELAPGFVYDPLAMTFVLLMAGPVYGELGDRLAAHGVEFATTDFPTGVLMSDGRSLALSKDRTKNIANFDALSGGDGARHSAEMADVEANAELMFGLFNNPVLTGATAKILFKAVRRMGVSGVRSFLGRSLISNRHRLSHEYDSDLVKALFAPWPLHAGLDPEQPFSGTMGAIMNFALEAIGAPISAGGAAKVADGLRRIIEEGGGDVRTGADVEAIIPGTDGRNIHGVRLAGGEVIGAPSVICSTTPTQLYERLFADWDVPTDVADATRRYRYGKANMQVHYALSAPVDWPDPVLKSVQLVHLTDGVNAVSKAVNEAERGMLCARPTVCVGQPSAADRTRAPDGKAVLWIQLPACPTKLLGDAAGEIEVPADGRWTETVREAYADRVEGMIEAHVPGFRDTVLARKAISPADLAGHNINLVDGDPYGGWCGIDQFFTFRPLPQQVNHNTFVRGVYHIGASTHPGPGLGGVSGYLLAKKLMPRKRFL
ncbi:MAG: NAD(P)/FAD-dependent oxidoreductase [Pseudomonadota bacterium]